MDAFIIESSARWLVMNVGGVGGAAGAGGATGAPGAGPTVVVPVIGGGTTRTVIAPTRRRPRGFSTIGSAVSSAEPGATARTMPMESTATTFTLLDCQRNFTLSGDPVVS